MEKPVNQAANKSLRFEEKRIHTEWFSNRCIIAIKIRDAVKMTFIQNLNKTNQTGLIRKKSGTAENFK